MNVPAQLPEGFPEWASPEQLAELLDCSVEMIHKLAESGNVPKKRVIHKHRFGRPRHKGTSLKATREGVNA